VANVYLKMWFDDEEPEGIFVNGIVSLPSEDTEFYLGQAGETVVREENPEFRREVDANPHRHFCVAHGLPYGLVRDSVETALIGLVRACFPTQVRNVGSIRSLACSRLRTRKNTVSGPSDVTTRQSTQVSVCACSARARAATGQIDR